MTWTREDVSESDTDCNVFKRLRAFWLLSPCRICSASIAYCTLGSFNTLCLSTLTDVSRILIIFSTEREEPLNSRSQLFQIAIMVITKDLYKVRPSIFRMFERIVDHCI